MGKLWSKDKQTTNTVDNHVVQGDEGGVHLFAFDGNTASTVGIIVCGVVACIIAGMIIVAFFMCCRKSCPTSPWCCCCRKKRNIEDLEAPPLQLAYTAQGQQVLQHYAGQTAQPIIHPAILSANFQSMNPGFPVQPAQPVPTTQPTAPPAYQRSPQEQLALQYHPQAPVPSAPTSRFPAITYQPSAPLQAAPSYADLAAQVKKLKKKQSRAHNKNHTAAAL